MSWGRSPSRDRPDPHERKWGHYACHFVCFSCRRSFKRAGDVDVLICSHCWAAAVNLGRNFKPPRLSARDQWEKVRRLVAEGFPYGAPSEPWPASLAEVKDFAIRNREASRRLQASFPERYKRIMDVARTASPCNL